MKQFIIFIAMICLGICIYTLIAGNGDDSLYASVRELWRTEITARTVFP